MSPPSRAVRLTAKACGIELNLKSLNLLQGEQKTPEFTAINPQQCVPTYVEGDFVLWER